VLLLVFLAPPSIFSHRLLSRVQQSRCQQFAAIVPALLRGVSNPTASNPPNNGATSESDDDYQCEAVCRTKRNIDIMESGTEERKMGIREWRRRRRTQGSVENGVSGSMYAHSSFSSTTPLKLTMQLDPTHQHHYSLHPPLFGSSQQPELNLTPIKKSRNG